MDELDREIQDRISRRRMIKRLGAATAVAWTAPVLSTLGATPAFAQGQRCPDCIPLANPDHCGGRPACGCNEDPVPGNTGGACDCATTPQGDPLGPCFCFNNTCCDLVAQACTSSAQCPPGWGCALIAPCCGFPTGEFHCLPPCGVQPEDENPNPDPTCTIACGAGAARVAGARRTTRD